MEVQSFAFFRLPSLIDVIPKLAAVFLSRTKRPPPSNTCWIGLSLFFLRLVGQSHHDADKVSHVLRVAGVPFRATVFELDNKCIAPDVYPWGNQPPLGGFGSV